jgi:hypothetical protein
MLKECHTKMDKIQVSPNIELPYNCPSCKNELAPSDWYINGMRCIIDLECNNCINNYYAEFPTNAGLLYPGIIDKTTMNRADDLPFDNWYLNGFLDSCRHQKNYEIEFIIKKNRKLGSKKIAILNTIDETYGHSLYELFNASHFLEQTDLDLILIVQKNISWLVPEGFAEVWILDLPFKSAGDWNNWITTRIKEELKGYKEIYICRTFVQQDSSDFNICHYTKIKPFNLNNWDSLLVKPTITFIWRKDRFWKNVLPGFLNNRYILKIFGRVLKPLENLIQFYWILNFANRLKYMIPNVDFAISGMDDRGYKLPHWIKDFRFPNHTDENAISQAKRYAESHLVIGCNGSSLLLPGCLAGAMINIVPNDQWAVSAGSFPFRITSIGDTHFRYVMLPKEIKIDRLIQISLSILRDRSLILLTTTKPWRDHDSILSPLEYAKDRINAHNLINLFNSTNGLITSKKKK